MRTGSASGAQIALLMFAVLLLAVPFSSYVAELLAVRESMQRDLLGRLIAFLAGALVIVAFPSLRRAAAAELSAPIPAGKRIEVAIVAVAKLPLALAVAGGTALWIWIAEGNAVLESRMTRDPAADLAWAFSSEGIVFFLVMGALIAPVLEEIVFRGFLFRAWERRWGWLPAMLGVSTLFGLYHSHFVSAFLSSILFVCLLRRTGSLWAPILVHGLGNALLWYPIAGQFLLPAPERAVGDLASWTLQLSCLVPMSVALPLYVWMARNPLES
jgi:uncharacterized protein